MKKQLVKVLAVVLSLVMILSLCACKQNDPQDEKVTIRFYNSTMSEEGKKNYWNDVIGKFNAEHENVTVECIVVDYNSMVTTFTNDLASGLSVDLIYGEVSWIPALAEGGFLSKPSDVLSADFYAGYDQNYLSALGYGKDIYGVPHIVSNHIIYVNKDLIAGAGLSMDDFPTTLDGLKTWIEKLSATYQDPKGEKYNENLKTVFGLTTAEVSATGSALNGIYTAFGGKLFEEDGSLSDLTKGTNNTAMTEMLDFCEYLIGNNYTISGQKLKDYRAAFAAGNCCMYVDTAWGYGNVVAANADAYKFTVSAPLPTTMGTYGKGKSIVESRCFLYGADLSPAKQKALDELTQYLTDYEVIKPYITDISLAYTAHKNSEGEGSPMLEGAKAGLQNVTPQNNIYQIMPVQTKLATMVLNHVKNGMTTEEAIAQYIKDANYLIKG